MGQHTEYQAARALRLLNGPELRHHPATGPTTRRSSSTTPGAPLNLDQVDYVVEHVDELIEYTRSVVPDPKPLPPRVEDLYAWCVDSTGEADEDQRRNRDIMLERHRLEHAVRLGDVDEVCKHPCPRCGNWGLMWSREFKRAKCSNRKCRTPGGLTSSWTLSRLAAQKIQRTEIWRRNAT